MQRLNYLSIAQEAMAILFKQESYLSERFRSHGTLNTAIWELIKLRASQLNQCAFCIDMHSKNAMEQGETSERIIGLSAWRDMPHYSTEERCALEWCERIVLGKEISDEQFSQAKSILGETPLVDLTIAVNAINSWNRISKAFKPEVGSFSPTH